MNQTLDQIYCVLDYETRSKADLKRTGAFEYARDPSTKILCVAWRIGTRAEFARALTSGVPARVWSPFIPSGYGELKRALLDRSVTLVAHNAFFEQVITRYVLSRLISDAELTRLPHDRWICTASQARALALPGKLEMACQALKLRAQKDMDGHRLMLKMSKPRKATKNNQAVWHSKLSDLKRLMDYCARDVDAEVELFLETPELSPSERELWLLDQKINFRGLRCDRPLVKKILAMIPSETARFERETAEITHGKVRSTSQRDATLKWLAENGCSLPDLKAKTVSDALSARLASGPAETLLRIRQAASKTSTAKYEAFDLRSGTDGRVRDTMVFHQASTGRWAGAGLQPHNFPTPGKILHRDGRPLVPNTDQAADLIAEPETDLEMIRLLYGNPLDVFASCLRSMIIPSDGKEFFGGDYAGVEVRVLFWIARHEDGLAAYRSGRDLYREIATQIYGKKLSDIQKPEREVGKRAILGCLAEGTKVLTEAGEKPIELIQKEDRIWNGKKFVGGVTPISRGPKSVIRINSLDVESTPDHWFLTLNGWRTAEEIALSEGIQVLKSEPNLVGSSLHQRNLKRALNAVSVCAAFAELKRISGSTNFGEALARATYVLNLEMVNAEDAKTETLTSSLIRVLERAGSLASVTSKSVASTHVVKTSRGMAVAEYESPSSPREHSWNIFLRSLGLTNPDLLWTELITTEVMSPETFESSLKLRTTRIAETFDLSEVPETNAFALADGTLAHNCGFGMGKNKFWETCKDFGQEVPLDLAGAAVTAYRSVHHPVSALWGNLERAALAAVRNPGKRFAINRTKWWVKGRYLFCELPSGRKLAYYGPEIRTVLTKWGEKKPALHHWDVHPKTKKWVFVKTWGGTLTENVVQATARDFMAAGMKRAEAKGYEIVLTVHDEELTEKAKGTGGSVEELERLMAEVPPWGVGCPIRVEGWSGPRYRKG